jgi:hypothetical protein
MVLVRFILNPIAKKSYQLVVLLVHEAALFAFLPFDDALPYGLLTLGLYVVYFLAMVIILWLRYFDIRPKNNQDLFFALERVLILK